MKIKDVCVIIVACIQWNQERVNISQEIYTIKWREYWWNIGIGRGFWGCIQVNIFLIWLIMRYQRVTSNMKNVQDNCGMIWKNWVIERTKYFIQVIEQDWQWTWKLHLWSLKMYIRKLTDYFFTIIYEKNSTIEIKKYLLP